MAFWRELSSDRDLCLSLPLKQDNDPKHAFKAPRMDEKKTLECSEVAAMSSDLTPIEYL